MTFIHLVLALWAISPEAPVDIGSRREMFVDRFLIERMTGVELRLEKPVDGGEALRLDRPWEGPFCGYTTVIRDGDLFRLYYRGLPTAGRDGNALETTCLAESRDGIHWQRPELDLFEVQGARKNNIILANMAPFSHNFSPFLDARPGVPPEQRYKAVAGISKSGLVAFVSADGIRWRKLREEPFLPPSQQTLYDSQNLAFWSEAEGAYVCYFRSWKKAGGVSYRWISRTTSKDFRQWTPPVEMVFRDSPPEHLYVNQTAPYFRAPHIYIGLAARFFPGRQAVTAEQAKALQVDPNYYKDTSEAVLLTSRGGNQFDRTFMEGFLRPGVGYENWVSRTNYPALNVVPTGPAEMSFYADRNYGQPSIHVRRYTLRTDGFASAGAGYQGGELVTRPFVFSGRELEINYSTSAAGGIRVEIQTDREVAVPGFGLDQCPEIIGDEIERIVTWNSTRDLSALARRSIRLRFQLKDANLYSFRFRP